MKRILPVITLLLFASELISAQKLLLDISYDNIEKNKDFQASVESFAIKEKSLIYKKETLSRTVANKSEIKKTCVLTPEQINKIKKWIAEKQLEVIDSLILDSDSAPFILTNIHILLVNEDKQGLINIRGNPDDLKNKTLYRNSMSLIAMVRKMLEACH